MTCLTRDIDLHNAEGRAIVQAVYRRLPTAAVRVRYQIRLCGICGRRNGTEAGFLQVLAFPCQFSFNQMPHVCMYVCTRVGQRLALAPRPLMIYCASPFD
jgi:hypothetical protein